MESEKLCFQWNDFQTNLNTAFKNLREDNDFNDVTLACEDGLQVEAHKVVLAAASPVFQNLLRKNKHTHPLIYMRGMKSGDLLGIIDFMYGGEANVFQEHLDSFLAIAEELQLTGLTVKSEDQGKRHQETFPTSNPDLSVRVANVTKDRNCRVEKATKYPPTIDSNPPERAVTIKGEFSENVSQLDVQIESMMEMSQNLISQGTHRAHVCKTCGKEGMRNDIRKHIEGNHFKGLSFPCNLCGKTSKSRNALSNHKHRSH